jgi:uncharacterized protein YlxW (UPF0749 family)
VEQFAASKLKLEKNRELLHQIDEKILKLQKQRKELAAKIEKQEGYFSNWGSGKKAQKAKENEKLKATISLTPASRPSSQNNLSR